MRSTGPRYSQNPHQGLSCSLGLEWRMARGLSVGNGTDMPGGANAAPSQIVDCLLTLLNHQQRPRPAGTGRSFSPVRTTQALSSGLTFTLPASRAPMPMEADGSAASFSSLASARMPARMCSSSTRTISFTYFSMMGQRFCPGVPMRKASALALFSGRCFCSRRVNSALSQRNRSLISPAQWPGAGGAAGASDTKHDKPASRGMASSAQGTPCACRPHHAVFNFRPFRFDALSRAGS